MKEEKTIAENIVSTQISTQKEQRWQEITQDVTRLRDKLGMEVDAGIFETVVALNALAVSTFASCEGHLDRGTRAPWVSIASQHPSAQISIAKLSDDAFHASKSGEKTQAEIDALFSEVHRCRREVKMYHVQERQKLLGYLASFYQSRDVPFDQRLIVRPTGTDGKGRLECQGADCQEVTPLEMRRQKLADYQAEMQAFTAFLKAEYFKDE